MKEFGDFQTNIGLAKKMCNILLALGVNPNFIIEPTCGEGNILMEATNLFKNSKKSIGVELQKSYVDQLKSKIIDKKIEIINDDVFKYRFDNISIKKNEKILLIGNPPWVTNSNLNGKNLPKKSNFKKEKGLDAITGNANFDISEFIILHLLTVFKEKKGYSAFLCKTQVARNIIEFLPSTDLKIKNIKIYEFDSKKEFNVSVDACLFFCEFGDPLEKKYRGEIYDIDSPNKKIKEFGWYKDKFVSNLKNYLSTEFLEGKSSFTWRSGVKHDCSKVMELEKHIDGKFKNKLGEILNIEDEYVFPLLKSSNIKGGVISNTKKYVIITQRKPGEETNSIQKKSPKLWRYLSRNKDLFQKRKSIIYKNNPEFSIFGIGKYSFSPYKVAISGLYKTPNFSFIRPEEKDIMLDDSCYSIGVESLKDASIVFATLNSKIVLSFLSSIIFLDSKRPYTKKQLMRINIKKATQELGIKYIRGFLKKEKNFPEITKKDFNDFLEKY